MHLSKKQHLFTQFLSEWGREFREAVHVVKYIVSHPELHSELNQFNPIDESNCMELQMEWVSLVARFTHPLDLEFWHPYYVPVQCDKYDLYLDISAGKFTLFTTYYNPVEPHGWLVQILAEDVRSFMAPEIGTSFQTGRIQRFGGASFWAEISRLSAWRRQQGYKRKIKPAKVALKDFFYEPDCGIAHIRNGVLTVTLITANIFRLLPAEIPIRLVKLLHFEDNTSELCPKIKNISALLFHFENNGFVHTGHCKIEFISVIKGFAEWNNGNFSMQCSEKQITEKVFAKISEYRKNYLNGL